MASQSALAELARGGQGEARKEPGSGETAAGDVNEPTAPTGSNHETAVCGSVCTPACTGAREGRRRGGLPSSIRGYARSGRDNDSTTLSPRCYPVPHAQLPDSHHMDWEQRNRNLVCCAISGRWVALQSGRTPNQRAVHLSPARGAAPMRRCRHNRDLQRRRGHWGHGPQPGWLEAICRGRSATASHDHRRQPHWGSERSERSASSRTNSVSLHGPSPSPSGSNRVQRQRLRTAAPSPSRSALSRPPACRPASP